MLGRNGRKMLAVVGMAAVLALATSRVTAAEKEGQEENEVKVKLADVPAAVRATLEKEAGGATLPDHIDKETDDGKTIYEVDVTIGGKNYEIKAAKDGTLLSKKLDEEDEKNGKEEKGEKGEKGEREDKD
jgi:hypothetical protein